MTFSEKPTFQTILPFQLTDCVNEAGGNHSKVQLATHKIFSVTLQHYAKFSLCLWKRGVIVSHYEKLLA